MNDIENAYREHAEQLSPEHKTILAKALTGMMVGEFPNPDGLPQPVREAITLFGVMKLEQIATQRSLENKQARDQSIKDMAVQLLGQLIQARPNANVSYLVSEAMAAAQKLHDMG